MTESRPDLPRTIGFWAASAIMVGIIIGSGIFRTPPGIAQQLSSPVLILSLWALGGVVSLFGALTYSELACMYPRSGGVYVFLREGLGPCVAFVFGWTYMLITKPFAAAGIAIVFGEHLNILLNSAFGYTADPRISTTAILVGLTAVNTLGLRTGGGVALVLTTLKILALLAIVALAVLAAKGGGLSPSGGGGLLVPGGSATLAGALLAVMSAVMWTYDGWSDVGAIAGEVKNPQRMLPLIYLVGTLAVTGLYVAVNAAYMWVIPLDEMRHADTVAPLVVARLLGGGEGGGASAATLGSVLIAAVVLVSTFGSVHGSIITGARVTFGQARDGLLFGFLGRVNPRFRTPAVALWFQLTLSLAALWFAGGFQTLADTFVFTMWIFYGLAAASIFILRVKRPDAERPYRCWGYPVVPALFILAAAAMTVLALVGPWEETKVNWLWVAVLLAGAPVYYVWRAITGGQAART